MDANTVSQMDQVSGLSAKDIQGMDAVSGLGGSQQPAQKPKSLTQNVSDFLRGAGLSFIPDIAADTYDIGKAGVGAVTGQKNLGFGTDYQNPFRNEQQLTQTRNQNDLGGFAKGVGGELASIASLYPGTSASSAFGKAIPALNLLRDSGLLSTGINFAARGLGRGVLNDLSRQGDSSGNYNVPELALSGASGAIMEPLMALIFGGGLTKGQVYKNMQKAAANADVTHSMTDIATEAKAELPDRLKATYNLNKDKADQILEQLLKGPGESWKTGTGTVNPGAKGYDFFSVDPSGVAERARMMGGNSTFTPDPKQLSASQLLEGRSWLSPEASQNYIERLLGFLGNKVNPNADLEAKVAAALKTVLSSRLKESAPQIQSLDQLYGMYNNPLIGPAWSWPLRTVAGLGAGGQVTKYLSKLSK